MRPHNAHVREYYRHIYPKGFALILIPLVLIFGFLMGILVANTSQLVQCDWPF